MDILFPLLLVLLLVPMFLGIRRQKREAEKVAAMQESLKVGDAVITTSGLWGTVVDVDEDTVDLEIAEDVVTTWLRQAIREVRVEDETAETTPETTATETTAEWAASEVEESAEQTENRLKKD
ncbi:MAG TPA: preprotein translocase subunit YajC [Nocardia sp.]|uniref:preprotein translocase subunit YajC n=1 Tax=Nocardia TaxID=1817 RepID=UPI0024568AD2|nr:MULTISPECIES: preprotein translocase subunit YajC [Nocardia]HLS75658.1 preprotein translocase subunit YajC [Nocardia sp.]